MPERDGYIPGVPCWVDTTQPDPQAAASFYGALFGWELEDTMPPEAPGHYFVARQGGLDVAAISSPAPGAPSGATWNTYVWVESADETAERVRRAGGAVLTGPFDVMQAGRMAAFADPEGAAFYVWQANEHKGARLVNEPVSLNFNALHTRDAEAAKSFYGAVFGWQTLRLPAGGETWTLPGYGDHLEERNPGLRKMIADSGGPAGFEDVVAAIIAIPVAAAERPARWSVQFSVADPDATAVRAEELGGRVVTPPFDAPWARLTVLADPQGAAFTATRFVPENKDIGLE
jgi:predicted enzyme related to lactoylglutathione lyase